MSKADDHLEESREAVRALARKCVNLPIYQARHLLDTLWIADKVHLAGGNIVKACGPGSISRGHYYRGLKNWRAHEEAEE